MRRALHIAGFTGAHLVLTFATLALYAAAAAGGLESGAPLTASGSAASSALTLLLLPLALPFIGPFASAGVAGIAAYVPFLMNSAIWGAGTDYLIRALRQRHARAHVVDRGGSRA